MAFYLDAMGSFKIEADFSKADWMNALFAPRTIAEKGGAFTGDGYYGAWIQENFWRGHKYNSVAFCVGTSLTIGTLGGYGFQGHLTRIYPFGC